MIISSRMYHFIELLDDFIMYNNFQVLQFNERYLSKISLMIVIKF